MSKRLYVKANFINHVTDGKVHTITATHGQLSATATAKSLGAAVKKAREELREQVIAAGGVSKPEVNVPTAPVSVPANLDQANLMALLVTLAQAAGLNVQVPASTPAPVSATPAPVQASNKALIGPNCEAWFKARLDAVREVGPRQKAAQKTRKGSFGANVFKTEIDLFMAARGCEPVYEGRTQEEIHAINVKTKKAFKHLRAAERTTKAA